MEENYEEMRRQIAILKNKLDDQEIVNDRMTHGIIQTKADKMKREMVISVVCAVFVIIVAPISFHISLETSWAFVVATDVMMLYCILREMKFRREVNDGTRMTASLTDVARDMAEFKKRYKRYTTVNIALLLPVWFGWLAVEVWMTHDHETAFMIMLPLTVGLVIGGVIGLRMYLRIQKEASEIVGH